MSDTPPPGPAALDIRETRKGGRQRLSFVWIVPVVALTGGHGAGKVSAMCPKTVSAKV